MDVNKKYVLVSSTCSEKEYDRIHIKDEYKTSQSAGKFFRLFARGFAENGEKIIAYTARPTTKVKSGSIYLKAKDEQVDGVMYHYSRNIHIKALKNLFFMLDAFFWFLNKNNVSEKDTVIIDPLNVSVSAGAVLACKIRKIKLISYITDVPTCYAYNKNGKVSLQQKLAYKIGIAADAFAFITEAMTNVMNPYKRPYVVIEGFADESLADKSISTEEKYKEFVVMYTGGIEAMYGLDMLVKGFINAGIPNSELHIYGAGSYVKEISEISKEHPQIKYLGCKSNAVIVEEQMKASLLVNPRYTDAEYTKYSFPGKNSEYMASGTATLTTKLHGMPEDFYPYVYLLDEENEEGIAKKLREIFEQGNISLYQFGKKAQEWIIENKCSYKQALKFIEFERNI